MSRFGVTGPGGDGSRFDRLAGYGSLASASGDQRDPYERRIDDRYEDRRYDDYYYRDDGRRDREDRERRWSPDRGSGRDRGYDRGYDNYRDNRNDGRRGMQNKMKGGNRNVRSRPSDAPHRAGILGAAPGEQPPAMPAELPGTMTGGPGGPQQQVLQAIQAQQTQTLLAALQATQAQLNQQQGLLPTPNMPINRNRRGFQGNQQNRKRGHQHNFGGPYNKRSRGWRHSDDRDDEKRPKQEVKAPDTGSPQICKEMIDRVEELRKRKKIDRNIADEDIEKLQVFCFDGKKYKCELCKIVCQKSESFLQHVRGKKHNLVVIEARKSGKDVHRDITDIDLHSDNWLQENALAKKILLKQSEEIMKAMEAQRKIEQENYNKKPSNFINYSIDTRKTAYKDNDMITFTSVSEAKVGIKEFSSENHMFGSEFIKAVFGFSCRLCSAFIRTGKDVVAHIEGKQHQSNYAEFLEKNEKYVENQVQRNKELESVLNEHLRKDVVLYESIDDQGPHKLRGKRYIYHRDPAVIRVHQSIPEWAGKVSAAGVGDGERTEDASNVKTDISEKNEDDAEEEIGEDAQGEEEEEEEDLEEEVGEAEQVAEETGDALDNEEQGSEGYEDGDAMEDDTDFDEIAFLEAAYGNDEEEEGNEEETYAEEVEGNSENIADDEYRPDEPTEDPIPEVTSQRRQATEVKQEPQAEPEAAVPKEVPFLAPEKANTKRKGRGGTPRGKGTRGASRGGRGRGTRSGNAKQYNVEHYEIIDEVGTDE